MPSAGEGASTYVWDITSRVLMPVQVCASPVLIVLVQVPVLMFEILQAPSTTGAVYTDLLIKHYLADYFEKELRTYTVLS